MTTMTKESVCGVAGCTTCKPSRIAHWFCAQCGGGPYRFDAKDAGRYRVLRPAFERNQQRFITDDNGVGRFHYTTRRICSQGFWQMETKGIRNDERELADRRPDLAPAIEAKHEIEQAEEPQDYTDDLGMNPGQY